MIQVQCPCGATIEGAESQLSLDIPCSFCGIPTRFVSAEPLSDGQGDGDFDLSLRALDASAQCIAQLPLGGVQPISVGKLTDNPIVLNGPTVSRRHARLERIDFGPSRWKVVDTASRNGVYVNGQRVAEQELQPGDTLHIGGVDFAVSPCSASVAVLAGSTPLDASPFDSDAPEEMPDLAPAASSEVSRTRGTSYQQAKARGDVPFHPAGPGKPCRKCGGPLPAGAKFCVACGTDQVTGKRQVLSYALDENQLAVNADTIIRTVSWVFRFGVFPIASEAYGHYKSYATWVIVAVTAITSIAFMAAVNHEPSQNTLNLMYWSGKADAASPDTVADDTELPTEITSRDGEKIQLSPEMIRQLMRLAAEEAPRGEFHWWQTVTHAFLHDPSGVFGLILHFVGNLLFLLVFGLRVNQLLGAWRFVLAYLAGAVASSTTFGIVHANDPPVPLVGASGAIMALAGMYVVFFPLNRVHVAIWFRGGFWMRFGCSYKIFTMPGFWLLVAWIAWNDLLPMAIASKLGLGDGVAHWAHLGGFLFGVVAAVVLLLTKQADAHGGDLLSRFFVKRHAMA